MIRRYNTVIVITVLTLFVLEGIIQTTFNVYSADWQFYAGAILTLLFWIFYFLKLRKLKTIIGLGLFLGSLNIIEFTYYHFTFVISWTPPGHTFDSIGFQPIIFILFVFFVLANGKQVGELIQYFTSKSSEEIKDAENQLVSRFRLQLETENSEQLQSIIEHPDQYQKEYVTAAKEIIHERDSKSKQ